MDEENRISSCCGENVLRVLARKLVGDPKDALLRLLAVHAGIEFTELSPHDTLMRDLLELQDDYPACHRMELFFLRFQTNLVLDKYPSDFAPFELEKMTKKHGLSVRLESHLLEQQQQHAITHLAEQCENIPAELFWERGDASEQNIARQNSL